MFMFSQLLLKDNFKTNHNIHFLHSQNFYIIFVKQLQQVQSYYRCTTNEPSTTSVDGWSVDP